MLCTATNTSPVQRAYMILQMVTSKTENLITSEVLFLLGTLKIPVKNPEDYENERKCLEKKKWTLNYFLFSMRLYCRLVQKRKLKEKNTYALHLPPPPTPHWKNLSPLNWPIPPKIAIGPPYWGFSKISNPPKSWGVPTMDWHHILKS